MKPPSPEPDALKALFQALYEERYIHSLSSQTYDTLYTLWHLNGEITTSLARILARTVVSHFCTRYLAHLHRQIAREAGLPEIRSSRDLGNPGMQQEPAARLQGQSYWREILQEEILPALERIVEQLEVSSLEDLVRLAHTGDHYLAALDEMEARKDPHYPLWLESLAHYYEQGIWDMGLLKAKPRAQQITLTTWVQAPEAPSPSPPTF